MSLVQLVFEAVGAPATADAVKLVTAALDATVAATTRASTATTAAVPATDALTAAAKKEAEQLAITRTEATSLNIGLVDMAAIVQAKLTPALAPATAAVQALGNASAATSQQVATSASQLASQANASRTSALASDYFAARQSAATPTVRAAVVAHRSLREQLSDMSAVLTDKLTPSLDPAVKGMLALGATALTVRAAWGLFTGVLADGSHFTALQARTGESIRNLVVIENAFKNAGVAGEGLTRSVSMIDSVLDGLDSRGKKSDITLARLGTTVAEMKVMGLAEQLATLRAGFAGIETQSERAAIVMQLFGREGGQLLQVLGNPAAWSAAEANAGIYAAQIEKNAERFRTMEKNVDAVRLQLRTMAAAALEQVVPALDSVAKTLGGFSGASTIGTILGMSGPSAAGGLAAVWGVDKLQLGLQNAAEFFKTGMLANMSTIGARFAAGLNMAIVPALALGIAAQVVAGVMEASNRGAIGQIYEEAARIRALKQPFERGFSGAATEGAMQGNTVAAQIEVTRLQGEINTLAAKQAADKATMEAWLARENGRLESSGTMPKLQFSEADAANLRVYTAARDGIAILLDQQFTNATRVNAQLGANQLAAAKEAVAPLVAALSSVEERHGKALFDAMTPEQQVIAAQSKRAGLEQQLANINPGFNAEERKAVTFDLETKIAAVKEQQAAAEKKIADEVKRAGDLEARRAIATLENQMMAAKNAGNEVLAQQIKEQIEAKRIENELQGKDLAIGKDRIAIMNQAWQIQRAQDAARKAVDANREATESKVYAIKLELAALDADYTRTTTEKWGERKAAIEKEVAALTEAARLDKERADIAKAAGDYKGAEMFGQSAKQNARGAIDGLGQLAQLGPDPQSWSQQWSAALANFRSEWEFSAQSVAQALSDIANNGLNNVISQLSNTLVVTGPWGNLVGNVARAFGVEVVAALLKMGAQYVITKMGFGLADKAAAAAQLAALVPIALATSAMWAGPATLSTIATMGTAAAAAPGQMALALGLGKGLALASDGGYFPGDEKAARGIFHGDEYIFSAPAVRRLGPENLERLHQSARSGSSSSVASALGGGGGGRGDRMPAVNILMDPSEFARMVQENSGDWFMDMSAKMQRS